MASNHASHADTAVIFTAIPKKVRKHMVTGAAQDYFFDDGFRESISRVLFNIIPISREGGRGGPDPLRHVSRALREGYGVLLFPEGTRSRDGRIGTFRSGIGRVIADFPGLPIIPTRIEGTSRVLPKGRTMPRPFSVRIFFGEPMVLHAHPKYRATWQQAANEVRDAVLQLGAGGDDNT